LKIFKIGIYAYAVLLFASASYALMDIRGELLFEGTATTTDMRPQTDDQPTPGDTDDSNEPGITPEPPTPGEPDDSDEPGITPEPPTPGEPDDSDEPGITPEPPTPGEPDDSDGTDEMVSGGESKEDQADQEGVA